MKVRMSDMHAMTEAERRMTLNDLADAAMAPRTAAQAKALDARLAEFEVRYEMSSADMLRGLADGKVRDTADIAKWAILARLRNGDA